jgi:hypothetical protein
MRVTSHLSISHAWEETKARIAADGRLILTVALAMIALPAAVAQFVVPGSALGRTPQSPGEVVLMVVVWLIGIIGQLALIRLAIGPSVSVGEAIAHGARRAPAMIGAIILVLVAMFLLSLPFVAALAGLGVSLEPGVPPPLSAWLLLLLFMALMLFVAVRMLMTSAIASAEKAGPIAIVRRSWDLTRGQAPRLLGFLILFIIGVVIVVAAVSVTTNLIVTLLVGPVERFTAAALIIALVEALASAVVSAVFLVMLARIYVQLTGGSQVEASVPRSGT